MAKIICNTLGVLDSNTYVTPKGNKYMFMKGSPTDVPDKEDEEFFIKFGNGGFVKLDIKEKTKNIVEKVTEKVKEVIETKKKMTKEEFLAMKKSEQIDMIKKLSPETPIPKFEKERVELLLRLQEE